MELTLCRGRALSTSKRRPYPSSGAAYRRRKTRPKPDRRPVWISVFPRKITKPCPRGLVYGRTDPDDAEGSSGAEPSANRVCSTTKIGHFSDHRTVQNRAFPKEFASFYVDGPILFGTAQTSMREGVVTASQRRSRL